MKIYIWDDNVLVQYGGGVVICAANNLEEARKIAIEEIETNHEDQLEEFHSYKNEYDTINSIKTKLPKIVKIKDFVFSMEGSS